MAMDGKGVHTSGPQLLDLIPKQRQWMVGDGGGGGGGYGNGYGVAEEQQLQLKLGPPVQEDSSPMLSLGFFPKSSETKTSLSSGAKRGFFETVAVHSQGYQRQEQKSGFLYFQTQAIEKEKQQVVHEKRASPAIPVNRNAPATHNGKQFSIATNHVVGWPPIRSFRKNLGTSSSKEVTSEKPESFNTSIFVKINMDGIPIGRKVDLKAYHSYENLSSAVDQLFKVLLAAQREPAADGNPGGIPAISGLLDGSGEYTLVYEDGDGDRMLVGDVPWEIFVSTVKRLRVLKTSELFTFIAGSK